jgi:AcrR family transcriptional regulator
VPTGVALRDVREQLFSAAERILLRAGPNALTSRAVTTEAACAKGVLHRHFADFDGFLTELVLDRIARLEARAADLHAQAGTGPVAGILTEALTAIFEPVTVSIVALITSRDDLRARLRQARPGGGIPLLLEATTMLTAYLSAERDHGRLAPDADLDTLALLLIGSGHLLFAARKSAPPPPAEVEKVVTTVITAALRTGR